MSKKQLETSCPSCKQKYLAEVDLPDPPDTRAAIREVVDEAIAKVQKHNGEMDEAKTQLKEAAGVIGSWQTGERHLNGDAMLQMLQSCPECKPHLDKHMQEARKTWLEGLTVDEAKSIAKTHKLWPPPNFEMPKARVAK